MIIFIVFQRKGIKKWQSMAASCTIKFVVSLEDQMTNDKQKSVPEIKKNVTEFTTGVKN